MGKVIGIISFLLTLTSFKHQSEVHIKSLVIYFVNSDLETPFSIDCLNFERFFKSTIKKTEVTKPADLKRFESLVNSYNWSSAFSKKLDVRTKVIVKYKNNSKSILCVDYLNLAYFSGKGIVESPELRKFIDSLKTK